MHQFCMDCARSLWEYKWKTSGKPQETIGKLKGNLRKLKETHMETTAKIWENMKITCGSLWGNHREP